MIRVLAANETQTLAEIAVGWASSGQRVGVVVRSSARAVAREVFDLAVDDRLTERITRANGDQRVTFTNGGVVYILDASQSGRGVSVDMMLYAHDATDDDVENSIPCVR